ncbi:MAG: WG repeat-containing protein [Bacteroidales bacterium]|nr:WG repeat-containing protein [Bacteroidales bacterium]
MKTKALIGAIAAWTFIVTIVSIPLVSGCSTFRKSKIVEDISDEGLLLNDDLVAYRTEDGKVSIRNSVTGAVTIKDIKIDWTQGSGNDSLAVFCSEGKRGYYNVYTGEIAVPAQYRRAWVFSEGLAAVQKNGNIGFIDRQGNVVIDFLYPYHGNPLYEFLFEDGHCIVADKTGKCGVIDMTGNWLISPEYDTVNTFREYAIVTKSGVSMQVLYDGSVLNSFVLDDICELTYKEQERVVTRDGEVRYIDKTVKTGLFAYRVGGRYGLMDESCRRLTEPLYYDIDAVSANLLRATLLDHWSEVILNSKGEVMR